MWAEQANKTLVIERGWRIGYVGCNIPLRSAAAGPVVKKRYELRVSTTPGNPGNLLEFKNPPRNLLEFNGPPGNFCVRCSTALVSGHKSGYQIAYS